MEWDPTQNSLVRVANETHRNYLRALNEQIEQHVMEQVNYERFLNDSVKEYEENKLKHFNSQIELYETFDEIIVSKFTNLDEIPTDLTLTVQKILKFRKLHNLLPNNLKNDSNAYVEYIVNIANIINHINQNLKIIL